jgi:hypothetical protein
MPVACAFAPSAPRPLRRVAPPLGVACPAGPAPRQRARTHAVGARPARAAARAVGARSRAYADAACIGTVHLGRRIMASPVSDAELRCGASACAARAASHERARARAQDAQRGLICARVARKRTAPRCVFSPHALSLLSLCAAACAPPCSWRMPAWRAPRRRTMPQRLWRQKKWRRGRRGCGARRFALLVTASSHAHGARRFVPALRRARASGPLTSARAHAGRGG